MWKVSNTTAALGRRLGMQGANDGRQRSDDRRHLWSLSEAQNRLRAYKRTDSFVICEGPIGEIE